MSNRQQSDDLERIQDRLNRARNNRTADQVVSPTPDSNVTSRIRASAGSSTGTSGTGSAASTWASIDINTPGRHKKLTPLAGIKKSFSKAASSRRIVAQDQSINLRASQDGFVSPEGRPSLYTRDSSTRHIGQPPFADEYDADPNAESEEYLASDKRRLSPILATIIYYCGETYTSLAYHADRLYLNCARGGDKTKFFKFLLFLLAAIGGIFGIIHLTKPSPQPLPIPTTPTTPIPDTGSDSTPVTPSKPLVTLTGRAGDIQQYLSKNGISTAELLGDDSSIQHRALLWIADTDPAQLATSHAAFAERYIMAVFYYATHGKDWYTQDGWMTGTGHCAWYGIECVPRDDNTQESGITRTYDDNDAITGMAIRDNNLRGSVPPELGKLSNTINLDFGDNSLTGEFPELNPSLKYLLFSNNQMNGTFPSHFKKLENLHALDISQNDMHGFVTEEIHALTNLRTLDMSNNQLSGSFPAIHASTSMTNIFLQNNQFKGTIPSGKLRDFGRLEILRLDNNTFTGIFPKQSIERLGRIEYIDFSHNDLTGSIPNIFQTVRRLTHFHLNNNRFRAEIPDSLMHLSGLKSIRLQNNVLTGSIPDTISLLADAEHLDFSQNLLTGQIPTFIGFPNDFTFISLKKNKLTGTIPSEIGNLFRLSHLDLNGNQLTGEIPPELGSLSALAKMHLHDNQFQDVSMPVAVCDKIRRGEMQELSADCNAQVTCDCCTQCYPIN